MNQNNFPSVPSFAGPNWPRAGATSALPRRPAGHLGKHVLGEFFDCERLPNDAASIRDCMEAAAEMIGATIVQSVFHEFNPYGVSGVVVIAESHLAIHTWPEWGCAAVDLFTCNSILDPRIGFDYLRDVFQARHVDVIELPRGAGWTTEDLCGSLVQHVK